MYKPLISLIGMILTYFSTLLSSNNYNTQFIGPAMGLTETQITATTSLHMTHARQLELASIADESDLIMNKKVFLQLRNQQLAVELQRGTQLATEPSGRVPVENPQVIEQPIVGDHPNKQTAGQQQVSREPSITPEAAKKPLATETGTVKYAALTFDDGPSQYTPQILKVLKEHNVHATFFVIGAQAQKNPEIIQQIHAEGHVVGNHTWNHKDLVRASASEIKNELETTNQLLQQILGEEVHLCRPPYGSLNAGVRSFIQEQGMQPVLWNVDPADWNLKLTSPVYERVHAGLKQNSLILLHDGGGPRGRTVESLPIIIDQMQQQGYQFVTVPEYMDITASK